MKTNLHAFLSHIKATDSPRFDFDLPDTLNNDLLHCYRHAVERTGCTFRLTDGTRQALLSAARWLQHGKTGLLLIGNCGTGKSKLMEAIHLLILHYSQGRQALQLHSTTRVCELSTSPFEDDKEMIRRLKTYRYLGLDDLGTETLTVKSWGTELSPVLDTLYNRYDTRRVTILTTNDSLDTLGKKYGPRMHDRFCEQYDRITFQFESYRKT